MEPEAGPRRRLRAGFVAQLAMTAVLVAVVLHAVPLDESLGTLRHLSVVPLAWALIWDVVQRALAVLRWHCLLAPMGARVPVWESLRIGFVGYFFGMFMPSTLGADGAKVVILMRTGRGEAAGLTASVLVDRFVIGWGSLLVFGGVASALTDAPQFRTTLAVRVVGGVVGAAAVVWLARRGPRERGGAGGRVSQLLGKAADMLSRVSGAVLQYRRHPGALLASFAVSCLGLVALGITMVFWCQAFGFDLSLTRGVAVGVIMRTVGMVPATVNGLGWQEGATVVLLKWVGMAGASALALALLQRVAGTVVSLLAGLLQFVGAGTGGGGAAMDGERGGDGSGD